MATLKEIAAKSGVCTATVSYVLNNRPGVRISEATRKRVLDAATELDYRPNALARSVRSGRSETIAFLYRDSNTSLYLDKVFRGIYSEATAAGFAVKNYFAGGELLRGLLCAGCACILPILFLLRHGAPSFAHNFSILRFIISQKEPKENTAF